MADSNHIQSNSKQEAGLFVVATPIGNLEDMTFRAVRVLKEVDVIACEDTRKSRVLCDRYGIKTSMVPYHDLSGAGGRRKLIEMLKGGKKVALISDAGMPLISDPGYKLVREAHDEGLNVTVVPGASAVVTGVALSGLPTDQFYFLGFLPPKQQARQGAFEKVRHVSASLVCFESAKRLVSFLDDVFEVLGEREVAVMREMTKMYEEVVRGSVRDVREELAGRDKIRGELVVVIAGASDQVVDEEELDALIVKLLPDMRVKEVVEVVVDMTGLVKRDVYRRVLGHHEQG